MNRRSFANRQGMPELRARFPYRASGGGMYHMAGRGPTTERGGYATDPKSCEPLRCQEERDASCGAMMCEPRICNEGQNC